MKKNITIKSNINKVVKIHNLRRNTIYFIIIFQILFLKCKMVANKKPTLKKSGKIAMKKKKLLNLKTQ
jgi:hypothetical protein